MALLSARLRLGRQIPSDLHHSPVWRSGPTDHVMQNAAPALAPDHGLPLRNGADRAKADANANWLGGIAVRQLTPCIHPGCPSITPSDGNTHVHYPH